MTLNQVKFKIGKREIGGNNPVFIIAELSANHSQKFDIAVKSIKAMKKAGADAVKLQTYTADTLTIDSNKSYFKIKQDTIWDGKTLYKLYQEAYTPWGWQPKLKKIAEDLGLIFFSSPFDNSSVDFLEKMKVPAYKVASFEITDVNLIEYMAKKGKPMIISTGIAKEEDIKDAITACKKAKNNQIALLKCTSSYPAPYEEMNLKTIPDMAKKFGVMVGISDHSMGQEVPIAATALGAKIIEKHFILNRKIGGPDSTFSMEPAEFKNMVENIRNTEMALGKITYELSSKAQKSREHARSLFIIKDIKKGEKFTEQNIRSIRPGYGLAPKYLKKFIGKKSSCDIIKGTPLMLKYLSK